MVSLLLCICLFCPVPMGGAEAPSGETAAEIPYEDVREDYYRYVETYPDTDEEANDVKEKIDEYLDSFYEYVKTYPTSKEEWEAWSALLDGFDLEKWMSYEQLETPTDGFYCFRLPGNVYAICEMLHEQQVFSFLIPGEERALLLDTGLGMLDIREVVDSLTDLPVTVLNSHDHFDHIGGNARFEEVWCYNDPAAIAHLTAGPSETELQEVKNRTKYIRIIMDYMDIRVRDIIPGKAPTGTVEDGQIIDLGGRKLEVIHTPGHQPSCIMLLDRENHLLFTGDMFYPGPMYCMFVDSSLGDYVQSIRKALAIAEENGVEQVYPSHNLPTADLEDLRRFSAFLEQVEAGEISEYEIEDGYPTYYMDDVYSISLAGEGQEPMSGFSGPAWEEPAPEN